MFRSARKGRFYKAERLKEPFKKLSIMALKVKATEQLIKIDD